MPSRAKESAPPFKNRSSPDLKQRARQNTAPACRISKARLAELIRQSEERAVSRESSLFRYPSIPSLYRIPSFPGSPFERPPPLFRRRPPLPPDSDSDSDDSSGPSCPPTNNKEELLSSEEDGNSSGADETSLGDETGSRVSVELGSEVDTGSEAEDLDLETGSEVVESESEVNTGDLDSADNSLDSEEGLDSVDEDLDSEVSLDSEESLDFDGGGYWSGSDDD
jgi:hypothetical protein